MAEQSIKSELALGFDRFDDVHYEYQPDTIKDWTMTNQILTINTQNGITLSILLHSPSILRFTYLAPGQTPQPHQYMLADIDKHPAPENTSISIRESLPYLEAETEALLLYIDRSDLRIKIYEKATQRLLSEDAAPYYSCSSIMKGNLGQKMVKRAQQGERFFGFGDKSGRLNLRGQKLENWNTDAFGFEKDTDPLYRSVPFYIGLVAGTAYGLFLNNTYRSTFDFDSTYNDQVTITTNGGILDYYFIYGPELLTVSQEYTQLTGLPELPPRWALGFHQCRWSYYPEERVHELAATFRSYHIPCDAIYLDIDYMDGYRCFTWNNQYFPAPAKMVEDLAKQGFHLVVMIDPGIKQDPNYWVYQAGLQRDVFCRRTNGDLMVGPVWPQECVFPDFTNPKVRTWWGELYESLYREVGVSGFWNDMNEPAVFKVNRLTFPDEVMHHNEGLPKNHSGIHNVYGQQMSRATYEGLKRLKPHKRPFLLTRATSSGGQRYAAIWTGDNLSNWEHLRLANIQCQRASISGFSFVGTDIGGFAGEPDGELMVRWLQLGIFHPLYRVHSMGNHDGGAELVDDEKVRAREEWNRLDQEPWSYGEPYTSFGRSAIELRYQLMGYLYTAFWQHINSGAPILKSLAFEDQHDPIGLDREIEFLVGDHLLVCPVLKPNTLELQAYFPKGRWYNFHTEQVVTDIGRTYAYVSAPLAQIPLFVRAGAVLPLYPVAPHTGAQEETKLTLLVYFGGHHTSSKLYQDQGEGYGYQSGQCITRTFITEGFDQQFQLLQQRNGDYAVTQYFSIKLIGAPPIENCKVDGQLVEFHNEEGRLTLEVDANFNRMEWTYKS